jgi:hypothetical protein
MANHKLPVRRRVKASKRAVRKSSRTAAREMLVGAKKPGDTQKLRRGLENYQQPLRAAEG